MNDIFLPSRFWNYIKAYIISNRRHLASLYGIIVGAALILTLTMMIHEPYYRPFENLTWIFGIVFWLFGPAFAASSAFSSLSAKTSRIASLMTPASRLEKFLTAIIVYVVLYWVVAIAGMMLCDLIYYLSTKPNPIYEEWHTSTPFAVIAKVTFREPATIVSLILVQSFFFLCSSIWPRRSFFKALMVLFVITCIATIILPHFHPDYMLNTFGLSIIAIGLFCLSWWRYTKAQVI